MWTTSDGQQNDTNGFLQFGYWVPVILMGTAQRAFLASSSEQIRSISFGVIPVMFLNQVAEL